MLCNPLGARLPPVYFVCFNLSSHTCEARRHAIVKPSYEGNEGGGAVNRPHTAHYRPCPAGRHSHGCSVSPVAGSAGGGRFDKPPLCAKRFDAARLRLISPLDPWRASGHCIIERARFPARLGKAAVSQALSSSIHHSRWLPRRRVGDLGVLLHQRVLRGACSITTLIF